MSPKKLLRLREKALDIAMCLLPDHGLPTDELSVLKQADKILKWLTDGETNSINKFKIQN